MKKVIECVCCEREIKEKYYDVDSDGEALCRRCYVETEAGRSPVISFREGLDILEEKLLRERDDQRSQKVEV